jgi:hypothetical protein
VAAFLQGEHFSEFIMSVPLVARKTRVALLLCLSLGAAPSAQAYFSPDAFLTHTLTHRNGGANTQIVKSSSFEDFRGTPFVSSTLVLPEVEARSLRSIAMLVAIGDERRTGFSMAVDSNVETLSGTIDQQAEALFLSYEGPAAFGNPVLVREGQTVPFTANVPNWRAAIPLTRALPGSGKHVLVTMHMLPPIGVMLARELRGNMLIEVNEAVIHGSSVVPGKSIVSPILLNAGTDSLRRWAQSKMIVASGPAQRDLVFVDQRNVPFDERVDISIRSPRSIESFLSGVYSTFGLVYHFFRNADLSWTDPRNNAPAHRVELVPAHEPEHPDTVEVTVASKLNGNARSDFGFAMGIAFCNDRPRPNGQNVSAEACTLEDYEAAEAIGDLTPAALHALIAQIDATNNAGAAATEPLRTGNARLERWLNENWDRASNALNAAVAIVGVSDMAEDPQQPGKRKEKLNGKTASLVSARCATGVETQDEAQANAEDDWQECTSQARRRLLARGAVSLVPLVQTRGGQYHLRNTPGFDLLVRQFRNSGKTLPPGISGDQFGGMTRAIARDAAHTGHNLGIVYLNDPVALGGNPRPYRFTFGLEHIWTPGAGGGDYAGHRDDWGNFPGLPINGREMLVNVIMAALTDVNAHYQQERGRTGNVVRTYRRFMFQHGGQSFMLTNIRIVLGQNGMVITAYPLQGAKAEVLNM